MDAATSTTARVSTKDVNTGPIPFDLDAGASSSTGLKKRKMHKPKTAEELNPHLIQLAAAKEERRWQQQEDSRRMAERQVEMSRQASIDFAQRLAVTNQRKREAAAAKYCGEQLDRQRLDERGDAYSSSDVR